MNVEPRVTEHWTMTGEGLILSGDSATIQRLLGPLGLPLDAPVRLAPSQAAIALWGDALATYLRHYRTGEKQLHAPARTEAVAI